ncbi:MAG: endonuclease/exonuclease/phosphatase family protein [Rhabdochlamydiaceae bacterium]|nr:endonuclease/exonuclease/phosphatase family protein [Rhabdochlamydiaceae bacterium]
MKKHLFSLSFSLLSSLAADTPTEPQKHPGIAYDWHYPADFAELCNWNKIAAYKLASYLTDPLCKAREYSVRAQILHELPPSPYILNSIDPLCSYLKQMQLCDDKWFDQERIARFAERYFLIGNAAAFSLLAPASTLTAMILRNIVSNLESDPFIHYLGKLPEQELQNNAFSCMQWNICGIKAGYEIEEGAQMPIRDALVSFSETRIVKIANVIIQQDPDVLSLNEVFDIQDALYLIGALQNHYAHFIIQCGPRTTGVNSGLFFASKFAIRDLSFTPFSKDLLVGNAQYAEKGFLTVKIQDEKGPIFTVISSHLQHSNEPQYPNTEEILARKKEMEVIFQRTFCNEKENVLITGDLNLDDEELYTSHPQMYEKLQKTVEYTSDFDEEKYTWLGDEWYINYGNRSSTFSFIPSSGDKTPRRVSQGINLDHSMVKTLENKELSPCIYTYLKSTGYDPKKISRTSLSDHMILMSHITIPR